MTAVSPVFLLCVVLSLSSTVDSDGDSDCYTSQYLRQGDREFEQKSKKFFEFNEQSNTWVEVELPYDLFSCINGACKVAYSIQESITKTREGEEGVGVVSVEKDTLGNKGSSSYGILPVRKRISLRKMSEVSVWVTGESGSIYERFWNGLRWVIAPHELPLFAGYAVSVFMINHTILALSEAGQLYQMQLTEDSQPVWAEFVPEFDRGASRETVQLASGVVSNDNERMYFCTKNGQLLELLGADHPRWTNHGRPPGANVTAITDAASVRPGLLFTVR